MEQQNNQAVLQALGYPVLPQSVVRTPRTERTVQRTQYDPNKLNAVLAALQKPRSLKTRGEVIAEVLAETPEARSFKGGYGEEIINPWAMGLSSFARAFGAAYKSKKQDEREKELEDRENALKAAQIALDADKKNITDTYSEEYMKINDSSAKSAEEQAQKIQQREAALSALHELNDLAESGSIWSGNNETKDWWLRGSSSKNIGRRDQALSTLIPMTNAIARASGGSGINTVGEMMAYLGVPENATSAQLKGALPGIIKKLGLESEYYQRSPMNNGMAF